MGLNNLIANLTALIDSVDDVIESTMEATEEDLIFAQQEQMRHGFDSEGKRIGVYADPNYEREKKAMNPDAGGWVDLHYYRYFSHSIIVNVVNGELVFDAMDHKTEDLVNKYGERIFGLSDQFKAPYLEGPLSDEFKQNIQHILGIRFK